MLHLRQYIVQELQGLYCASCTAVVWPCTNRPPLVDVVAIMLKLLTVYKVHA